ncbi:MAG: transposase [Nitrospira sp.]|nr:transposase [Nitrospira sp.]
MSQLFLLSKKQFARIKPYVPLSPGVSRVDDLRVVSGIIYVIKHGLPWKDAPRAYGSNEREKGTFSLLSKISFQHASGL